MSEGLRKRRNSPGVDKKEAEWTGSRSETVHVVKLNSCLCLLAGIVIGSVLGGPWRDTVVEYFRGYRWDYMQRCILETPEAHGNGVDFCRNPVDCNECKDIHHVDEV